MKRYIFFIAAALLAAVSCSKIYDATPVTTDSTPIGFGTWAETLTKGRAIGGTAFAGGDKFYVYGFKTASTNTNVFDGDEVRTTDGSTWTYSPTRFWDTNTDSYTFYGVSPSEDIAVGNLLTAHDVQAGTMTSADFVFNGKNRDFLIADKKTVAKANYNKDVVLNFRHAGAKFDLQVRKGDGLANATLKLTKVSLNNIQNSGKFSVTGYNASSPFNPTITWADAATPTTGSYSSADGVTAITIDSSNKFEVTADKSATAQTIINTLMVIPQTFSAGGQAAGVQSTAQQLEIEYEITTGTSPNEQTITYHKYYDLKLFDNTDYPDGPDSTSPDNYNGGTPVSGWVPGFHYTYIITIDANAIVFGATMQAWDTANGYYYLVN